MDVNEIKSVKPVEVANSASQATRKPASALSAESVNTSRAESVRVEIAERPERTNKARENANEVINTLNFVTEVTEEIDKIVTSLSGLAEQASDNDLPDSRRQILENEAQELLKALDERSQIEVSPPGIKPLQGDPIELEVEEELGKALKVILPETTPERLGLENITVSKVDQILATRRSIEEARERLEELRTALTNSKSSVQEVLDRADIAAQNREAAETQIRDVDAALQLTGGLESAISEDPSAAISAAVTQGFSIRLLESE